MAEASNGRRRTAPGPARTSVAKGNPRARSGSTLHRLTLRARLEGPLAEATSSPRAPAILAYPIPSGFVLLSEAPLGKLAAALDATGAEVARLGEGATPAALLLEAPSDQASLQALAELGAHVLPPILWQGGRATLDLLVRPDVDAAALVSLFPEAELLRRSRSDAEGSAVASPWFLPTVTAKQAEAVLAAHAAGYYEQPRRAEAQEVCRKLGLGRSAFGDRLARAEGAMVASLLPVLRLRAAGDDASGDAAAAAGMLELYSAFSRDLHLFVNLQVRGEVVEGVSLSHKRPAKAQPRHAYLAEVLRHLREGSTPEDVPYRLGGSPFEQQVLEFLRTIPPGTTMTYAQVAAGIGKPRAARAVGQACSRNPVMLLIPCHRVVRTDGGLGGYAGLGGTATKAKLLARERAKAKGA